MKNILYKILLVSSLFLSVQNTLAKGGTCEANYSYVIDTEVSSFTYLFKDLSSSTSSIIYWSWNFGDGYSSENQNPEHQYFVEGSYIVSLNIICQDGSSSSKIDTIEVKKVIPSSCVASFTSKADTAATLYSFQFTDHSVSPGDTIISWVWDFGDGSSTSNQQNPSHQYTSFGAYSVSLSITTTNGCSDVFIKTLMVSATPPSCNAYFNYSADSVTGNQLLMFFFDQSTADDPIISWHWNFADGDTSNVQNPVHLFPNPGIYEVYLTIKTQTGCISTVHYPIQVGHPQKYNLWGRVYVGNLTTDKCIALLYKELSNGFIVPIDTVRLISVNDTLGVYYFYQILEGMHKVKLILPEASKYSHQYAPTYYGDDVFWTKSSALNLNHDLSLMNINMESMVTQQGNNFISGTVQQNNSNVSNMGIQIMLLDFQQQVYAYTFTDSLGAYRFENVPMGNFRVYAEVTGLYAIPGQVFFNAPYDSIRNMNIYLTMKNTQVGIEASQSGNVRPQLKIFPNPVHSQLNLELLNAHKIQYRYEVVNTLGRKLIIGDIPFSQRVVLDVRDIESGFYIVNVYSQSHGLLLSRKFIKQ